MGGPTNARPTIEKSIVEEEARHYRQYGGYRHKDFVPGSSSPDRDRSFTMGSLYDANEKPADLLKPNWFGHESSSLLNKFFEQYQHDVNRFEGHTTSKRLTNSRQFARLMKLITKEEHVERFRGAIVAGRNKTRVWSWRGSELKFDLFLPEADTAGTVLVYITADGRIWENAEEILVSARRSAFSRIWNEPEENLTDPTEAEDPLVDVLVLGYYKTPADRATLPLWHVPGSSSPDRDRGFRRGVEDSGAFATGADAFGSVEQKRGRFAPAADGNGTGTQLSLAGVVVGTDGILFGPDNKPLLGKDGKPRTVASLSEDGDGKSSALGREQAGFYAGGLYYRFLI